MTDSFVDPIAMLPFGMLNAFLVVQRGVAMLVDTGLPGSAGRVERALARRGLDWSHLSLIVLTHAHIDHAGSAVALRARAKAPILAHHDELAYCAGEPPLLRPTGPFGRLFHKTGAIQRPFDYFTPDTIISGDGFDLAAHGFDARLIHTPGHTPGSLSVLLPGGEVIAGDLAASGILLGGIALRGRPKRPPFEEQALAVADGLARLLAMGATRFYLGHGGPLSAAAIRRHEAALRLSPASASR